MCKNCKPGFFNTGFYCFEDIGIPLEIENCKTHEEIFKKCIECEEGYVLYPDGYKCLLLPENCSLLDLLNPEKCFECKEGFFLNNNALCTEKNG